MSTAAPPSTYRSRRTAISGRGERPAPLDPALAGVILATLCAFVAVGAVLPVLPSFVRGPLGAGDLAVGVVIGAYTATGLVGRPFAGREADRRGRRRAMVAGLVGMALAGALYLLPAGVAGLVAARLVLGAGEALVVTAGGAWVVDLSPRGRRGQVIGLFGLGIWGGIAVGPLAGLALLAVGGHAAVWGFAALLPLVGVLALSGVPDRGPEAGVGSGAPGSGPGEDSDEAPPLAGGPSRLLPPQAVRPGIAIGLGSVGFATLAGFLVLHLDARGVGHGTAVFSLFAGTVVLTRLATGRLPDRFGAARAAVVAGVAEAVGLALIAAAGSWPVAALGAVVMGLGFSVLYPALALIVVERVDEREHGAALGTYSAFFDVGVGIGAPMAGAVAASAGYGTAFAVAAGCALAGAAATVAGSRRTRP